MVPESPAATHEVALLQLIAPIGFALAKCPGQVAPPSLDQ
jgi:hypothetical protein